MEGHSFVRRSDSRWTWELRDRRLMAKILVLMARRLNSIESGSCDSMGQLPQPAMRRCCPAFARPYAA